MGTMATSAGPDVADPAGAPHSVLHKVRSLLAKAESTTFPDEAEALTAKAQELMDRHAIDRAMLAAASPGNAAPEGRQIPVDAPYANEKFHLLSEVARANRCRAVFASWSRVATVVGFAEDQETVEVLYTSLLVQATTAMLARGDRPATRTRRFRQSFLIAFAARVGQRLQAADDAVVAEADRAHDGGVLPVLASRVAAVEDHVEQLFPDLRRRRVEVRDAAGWHAGTQAADRAQLGRDGTLRASGRARPLADGNMTADG